MEKRLFAGLAMGLLLLGMAELASASLVTNGSFEVGTFTGDFRGAQSLPLGSTQIDGWTVINAELAWITTPNFWDFTASDGLFFLDLSGYHDESPYGGVSQDIVTTTGQQYRLSFHLGTNESDPKYSGPVSVTASAGSTSQTFEFNPSGSGNQWQAFNLDFVADSADISVSIIGESGVMYIGLDQVSVAPVPLPSTVWLLGAGIIGLTGSRIRRKKQQLTKVGS